VKFRTGDIYIYIYLNKQLRIFMEVHQGTTLREIESSNLETLMGGSEEEMQELQHPRLVCGESLSQILNRCEGTGFSKVRRRVVYDMDHEVVSRCCKIRDWLLNLSWDHFGLHFG
jgi:hypothetical protein